LSLAISLALIAGLGILAYVWRVYPNRVMVWLVLVPALASLLMLRWLVALWPLLALDGLAALMIVLDLFSTARRRAFSIERATGRVASLAKPHDVSITLSNLTTRGFLVAVRDGVPEELNPEPAEFNVALKPRTRATLKYRCRAGRRGAFVLSDIHLCVRSRWGLWQRFLDYPCESVLHVYPDMKQMSEYAVLARTNRLSLMGVRRTRRIGQDNEFERLRDYTRDDNFKHIDWRATARRRKLTVKEFQRNQSQRIIFLIDCGRMMTNQAAGLSLLDHALNAMFMLGYVALSHGDSVGLLCFSDEVHTYVPPRGGRGQNNRLLHACFDRFPRRVESRYDKAFLYLNTKCRKRSLVVLVTNVIDEVNSNQIKQYLGSLSGGHLPLGVLLRDRRVFDYAEAPDPADDKALYRAAAAAEILSWRAQVLTDLVTQGVLVLDVFPEDLTAPLVNRYLEVKARHLL